MKKCTLARFSQGGHLIATVGRSNAIHIYPTFTWGAGTSSALGPSHTGMSASPVAIHQLKAHVSTVTDVAFTTDDTRLISVGAGGACYFWDLQTGSRIIELEYVDKKCIYYSGECMVGA